MSLDPQPLPPGLDGSLFSPLAEAFKDLSSNLNLIGARIDAIDISGTILFTGALRRICPGLLIIGFDSSHLLSDASFPEIRPEKVGGRKT